MFTKSIVFSWIKRFKALFIAMVLLMSVGMSFAVGMVTGYVSLGQDYQMYIDDYKAPHGYIESGLNVGNYEEELNNISEDIEKVDGLLVIKAATYIDSLSRSGNCQYFTYDDPNKDPEHGDFFNYYERDSVPEEGLVNPVYLEYAYAKTNNLKAGDTIKLGYLDLYVDATIEKIVSFPDALEYGPSGGVASGTVDFGYVCSSRKIMLDIANQLLVKINDKLLEPDVDKKEELLHVKGILTTMIAVGDTAVNMYEFRMKDGKYDQIEHVLHESVELLESKGVSIDIHYTLKNTTSYKTIDGMMKALRIMSFAIPISFYIVVLFVVSLFLKQIVSSLQRDIGILKAIGAKTKSIVLCVSLFALIASILSILLGSILGVGMSYMSIYFDKVGLNVIGWSVNALPLLILICSGIVIVLFQIAALIATRQIFKVSPKEAMIENNDNIKELPNSMNRMMKKMNPTAKLAFNSTLRNFSRVVTSVISLLISISFISMGTSMLFSRDRAFNQSFDSLIRYDAQIVFVETPSESSKDDLKANASVTDIQDVIVTSLLTLEYKGNEERINIMAFENDEIRLMKIASSDGESVQELCKENEIILNTTFMTSLGINVGDKVNVNGYELTAANPTNQYAITTCYCRYNTLLNVAPHNISTSYLVNFTNLELFENHISSYYYGAYPVVTKYLKAHRSDMNSVIDSAAIILNVTFVFFGLLIVTIMSISNLQSQKKSLSILRALGLSMRKTSNLWLIQLLGHYLTAGILAFPVSYFSCKVVLEAMSTNKLIFPFSDKLWVFLIAYFSVLAFVMVSHLFVVRIIKRWNIADNTKSKE